MAANFTINQAGGAGAGTLGTARPSGIWRDVAVQLVAAGAGPYIWSLVSAPPGSSATLTGSTSSTASFTPDVATYPYRVRLVTGTGSAASEKILVVCATKDNSGVDVNRGWSYPAAREAFGEDNSSSPGGSDNRGYAPRMENILDDVLSVLGGGSGGPGAIVYRPEAGSPATGEYLTFADALAAAQAVPGEVNLYIDTSDASPASIPAGTYNLQRRIRLVGLRTSTGPSVVTLADGCHFVNACLVENCTLVATVSSAVFTSSGGGLDLVFKDCIYGEDGNSSDFFSLATGSTHHIHLINSTLSANTRELATVSTDKTLYIVAEQSTVVDGLVAGSAGDLWLTQDAGSDCQDQSGFSGTSHRADQVLDQLGAATRDFSVNGKEILNAATPTADSSVATRGFVKTQYPNGSLSKSIAAGGTITLGAGEHEAHVLRLTGAAASDTTVVFPATAGREWFVCNESTDNSRMVVLKASGGSKTIYLGPGCSRRVTVRNGELDDDAGGVAILIKVPISLITVGAGPTDTILCKLPAGVSLRGTTVAVSVAAVGGTSTASIGTALAGVEVQQAVVLGAAGSSIGDDSGTDWGTDMSATGRHTYASATTLYFRSTSSAALSDGAVVVTVEAVVLL